MTNEERIINLFNRTELRYGEDVINNTDPSIANELGINLSLVTKTITKYLDDKIKIINARDIFINKDTMIKDYEISLERNEFLEKELNKSKEKYNSLFKKHQKVNRDSDRLKVCREMILEGFNTKEITSALGYVSRTALYDCVKRVKGIKFVDYKKQLLNEQNTKTLQQ